MNSLFVTMSQLDLECSAVYATMLCFEGKRVLLCEKKYNELNTCKYTHKSKQEKDYGKFKCLNVAYEHKKILHIRLKLCMNHEAVMTKLPEEKNKLEW